MELDSGTKAFCGYSSFLLVCCSSLTTLLHAVFLVMEKLDRDPRWKMKAVSRIEDAMGPNSGSDWGDVDRRGTARFKTCF